MKARYQYRFYPTDQQQQSLARLFGCVRVVYNDALAICKQSEKKPKSAELQKIVITQAKKTEARAWLSEDEGRQALIEELRHQRENEEKVRNEMKEEICL